MEIKDKLKTAIVDEIEISTETFGIDLNDQIKKFKEKTGKDFTEFYNKYLPKLIYFSSKYCKDNDEARDFAEESFIAALEKIDTFDIERGGFSTWLFTIARNHVFANLRKKKRLPTISMDVKIDEEGTTIKEFISDDGSDCDIVNEMHSLTIKKANIMRDSIDKLKPPYRYVIEMRELKEMSYKDIASKLGRDVIFNLSVDNNPIIELPDELSSIYEVRNSDGDIVNFTLIEGDVKKTPFYTHIKLESPGSYNIKGRNPKNISTVKSQIRNGRSKLRDMVKESFQRLDEMYL